MRLWYKKPATQWEEALPIGNGRLGAMVCGGIQKETLYLNEDSIWYGRSINRINPDAKDNLDKVRTLILNKEVKKAEQLLKRAFSGTPQSQRPYQPLGNLDITMQGIKENVEDYERSLDLEHGICTTSFWIEDTMYEREVFSSYPDQVMVFHLSSNQKGRISFDILLTRERFYDTTGKLDENSIFMEGNLSKGGIDFFTGVSVQADGGQVNRIGEHLVVEGADSVTIYLSADTSFYVENPKKSVQDILKRAQQTPYEELKQRHSKDVQGLMNRVVLRLDDSENSLLPTDERRAAFGEGAKDNSLAALYFQYGRYLLVSSSRPGSLPTNLQGIWNNEMRPSWDSKYTININTEMNYWPAEICNLSECHMPLFDHLQRLVETGKQTAKEMYGCRGFCAHHNTDIWADSAPQDIYIPATYWTQGGAWLCTHLWTHYAYTLDKDWLKQVAYPIMREAVLFYEDFLIEKDGYLVTCPSVSPENTYIMQEENTKEDSYVDASMYTSYLTKQQGTMGCICYGPTMDNQILRDVFTQFIKMVEELEVNDELEEKARYMIEKLPPNQIGKYGQIMEWCEDYDEAEPGHRHISQLYGLHPSHQITISETPELAKAAENTLKRRLENGGGHTGWSCAWILNFYTRLQKGDKALTFLHKLMKQSTFPNLMDNHPKKDGFVFQIDGNFGACAGIAEMLVQSHEDKILLLPALPKEWEEGEVKGLCVYGGGTIDLMWKNHELINASLHVNTPYKGKLIYQGKEWTH